MIKEILERRRREKLLRTFREEMAEEGIFIYHLTDDELMEQISKWAERIAEASKPLFLTISQASEAMSKIAEAFEKVKSKG